MNRKERVICTLNHKSPDVFPHQIDLTADEHLKMVEFYNDENFMEKYYNHLHYVEWNNVNDELEDKKEHYKDYFGVIWNKSGADKDIGVIDNPIFTNPDINLYDFPTINENEIKKTIENKLKSKKDMFTMGTIGFSLFERAWSLRGFQNLLMDMAMNPEFVHLLLDKICEFNLKIIQIYSNYSEIDGFYFGDDWGQQKGLIMGPTMWREFILPRLKRMYSECKKSNLYVLQHSCGDIEEVFPDLIDAGLDCYNTFQPEIYEIEKVKKTFGNSLSFWGGISTQQLLPFESKEKVYEESKRIIDILNKDGGYIAAPTHAIPHDVPAENVDAVFKVFMGKEL